MPRPAYPTLQDFLTAFADSGLVECLPGDTAISDALVVARVQWETDTDQKPFLFSGTPSERSFDAPGPIRPFHGKGLVGGGTRLSLRASLLSLETLKVGSDELLQGRDFFLDPPGTYEESGPITSIRFVRTITSAQQGVKILGDWGFCRQLPDDVWRAVLLRAAWEERETIARKYRALGAEAQSKLIKAKESGPLRLEFAVPGSSSLENALDLNATFAAWQDAWTRALRGRVMQQP